MTTTTGTTQQVDRVIAALEDILRVAIEIGGVEKKQADEAQGPEEELEVGIPDNRSYFCPAFRDPEFSNAVVDAWLQHWEELDHCGSPAWLAPQLEELITWLQSLQQIFRGKEAAEES